MMIVGRKREIENMEHTHAPTCTQGLWVLLAPFCTRAAQAGDRSMTVSRELRVPFRSMERLPCACR